MMRENNKTEKPDEATFNLTKQTDQFTGPDQGTGRNNSAHWKLLFFRYSKGLAEDLHYILLF